MSKYIIGGGIAGLITAFYNKDYKLITDKIGGQMSEKGMGPRLLEVNQYSKEFLHDIGIDNPNIKIAKIGFRVNGLTLTKIDEEIRKMYYVKSRNLDFNSEVPKSIMSDGKNEIHYFDVGWDEIVERLKQSIIYRTIIAKIEKINVDHKILYISDGSKLKALDYDKLISTIPAPIFLKISNTKPIEKLTYCRKTFIVLSEKYIDMKGFDYIYFPEYHYNYHRISKVDDSHVAIEYTTDKKGVNLGVEWNPYCSRKLNIEIGQIQSGKVNNVNNVIFVGRYAQWDHDIKADDIIKMCKEGLGKNG